MKIVKWLIFILFQFLVCFLFLETFSYFFLKHSSNPLYRARRILTFHSELGWMQKGNLDTTFEGQSVYTDENGYRINADGKINPTLLTLGPSSAFGWGVSAEETYTSIVGEKAGGYLNASGIGHSIYQGNKVWRTLSTENPKIVLIAYGVNDLDKFRFFDIGSSPDREYFAENLRPGLLDSVNFNITNVLSLAVNLASQQTSCEKLKQTSVRVPWDEYEEILRKILREMKLRLISPVVINTPYYLKNPRKEFKIETIEEAYAKASFLAREGKCKEALETLKVARSWEPENILYQVQLFNKKLAQLTAEEKVPLVDAFSLLKHQPKKMFYDPVHPSAAGHKEIAGQILKTVFN